MTSHSFSPFLAHMHLDFGKNIITPACHYSRIVPSPLDRTVVVTVFEYNNEEIRLKERIKVTILLATKFNYFQIERTLYTGS